MRVNPISANRFRVIEGNVGNISEVAGDSKESVVGVQQDLFSFVVDDVAPTVGCEIIGDAFKGKYQYVSARSTAQVKGDDDQVGIFKILYNFNSKSLEKTCQNWLHRMVKIICHSRIEF